MNTIRYTEAQILAIPKRDEDQRRGRLVPQLRAGGGPEATVAALKQGGLRDVTAIGNAEGSLHNRHAAIGTDCEGREYLAIAIVAANDRARGFGLARRDIL